MAGSVNKVILVGNVGKDPESRTMQNGNKVVSFSLATSESWNDKMSGERREKTQWHRIVIYNDKIGEIAEKYVKKGSSIYIEGAVESRKYTDKDGQEKEITEIVLQRFRGEMTLLGGRPGGEGGYGGGDSGGGFTRAAPARAAAPARSGGGGGAPSWEPPAGGGIDDDIPF